MMSVTGSGARVARAIAIALAAAVAAPLAAAGQTPAPAVEAPYEPQVGQQGKDVVWVPTSPELLEAMLDLAQVTKDDFVMDLGSGDGRNIIAAARRGARGVGVEFNPDMVELSRRLAREAGVADRAEFVEGDMYEADISRATVLALFLLPHNLEQLKPKLLALPPGTRIVMNTFTLNGWEADATRRLENDCTSWCTALLHIVPAQVGGVWTATGGRLELTQDFQHVTGTFTPAGGTATTVSGSLRARQLTMQLGDRRFVGQVDDGRIVGTLTGPDGASSEWTVTR